jgi:hypothetical protein
MVAPVSPRFRIASAMPTPALEALREQVACLRALLDEIDRVAPVSAAGRDLSEQIVDELTRLGNRSLDAATELRRVIIAVRRSV